MDIIEARQAKQEIIDYCYATDKNVNVVLNGLLHFQGKYLNKFHDSIDHHQFEDAMLYDQLVKQTKVLYDEKLQEH